MYTFRFGAGNALAPYEWPNTVTASWRVCAGRFRLGSERAQTHPYKRANAHWRILLISMHDLAVMPGIHVLIQSIQRAERKKKLRRLLY